ncbi:hypothetical protein [Shewanella sp. OMA3-2]|uniref:hypothetical protein n=1 Tax=Shewanella sp. OMA3-2 TaxID=2908650 RepID=UPI001F39DA1C|nr:hypothetical protein [Shewanella sp. OMA3-2]UJF21709.1 hypothetical protein L0B17_16910 [Shewanella sp. OMA3-2]
MTLFLHKTLPFIDIDLIQMVKCYRRIGFFIDLKGKRGQLIRLLGLLLCITLSSHLHAKQLTHTAVLPSTLSVDNSSEWVDIFNKRALVCPLVSIETCLKKLPQSLQGQISLSASNIRQSIGYKSAMVLAVNHSTIAGIIAIQAEREPKQQTGALGLKTYGIELVNQAQLSLWHEVGHLHNIALQGKELPTNLTDYQHEWLADVYLFWHLAQSKQLHFAWQQLHRRNLAVIHDSDNLSHWSAPQLQYLLQMNQQQSLVKDISYRQFMSQIYPHLPNYSTRDISEFSSLIQRTFGAGVVQPLPNYMFWRQPDLAKILQPTLDFLMGKPAAQKWLSQYLESSQHL